MNSQLHISKLERNELAFYIFINIKYVYVEEWMKEKPLFNLIFWIVLLSLPDIPAQVPPLTPGTNKKMTEALKASFGSWEKELGRHNIPKGKHF